MTGLRTARIDGTVWDSCDVSTWTLDMEEVACGLANTCRFNGRLRQFYSVAQHSWLVASMVEPELRPVAMLHDAGEVYSGGDLPRPHKHLAPALVEMERVFCAWLADVLGVEELMPPEVVEADNRVMVAEFMHFYGWDAARIAEEAPMVADLEPAPVEFGYRPPHVARHIWQARMGDCAMACGLRTATGGPLDCGGGLWRLDA